jgi:glycosyltransferase involved in cell wall biosynthesis
MPLLSVILPVHNCRRYLAAAIASIVRQSHRDFEFIIVDDGSTDGSAAVIDRAAAADPRIRVIRRPNTGIVGALNDGLAAAQGEFIARMDGDDLAEPARFAAQLAYLSAHPECVAVGSAVWFVDSAGAVVDRYAPPPGHAAIEAELLRGNGGALIHPALMLRRAAVTAAGGYRREYDRAEDLDLFLRLARHGRLANLPVVLLRYRLHLGSTNFVHREQQRVLSLHLVTAARAERGLPALSAAGLSPAAADLSPAARHRGWVITALRWGRRPTAIKHALLAVQAEPAAADSWKHLRYACTAPHPATP